MTTSSLTSFQQILNRNHRRIIPIFKSNTYINEFISQFELTNDNIIAFYIQFKTYLREYKEEIKSTTLDFLDFFKIIIQIVHMNY
jgi:hypothetical protein